MEQAFAEAPSRAGRLCLLGIILTPPPNSQGRLGVDFLSTWVVALAPSLEGLVPGCLAQSALTYLIVVHGAPCFHVSVGPADYVVSPGETYFDPCFTNEERRAMFRPEVSL